MGSRKRVPNQVRLVLSASRLPLTSLFLISGQAGPGRRRPLGTFTYRALLTTDLARRPTTCKIAEADAAVAHSLLGQSWRRRDATGESPTRCDPQSLTLAKSLSKHLSARQTAHQFLLVVTSLIFVTVSFQVLRHHLRRSMLRLTVSLCSLFVHWCIWNFLCTRPYQRRSQFGSNFVATGQYSGHHLHMLLTRYYCHSASTLHVPHKSAHGSSQSI